MNKHNYNRKRAIRKPKGWGEQPQKANIGVEVYKGNKMCDEKKTLKSVNRVNNDNNKNNDSNREKK